MKRNNLIVRGIAVSMLCLCVLCNGLYAHAVDYKSLMVTRNDGGTLSFALSSGLTLRFTQESLEVTDEGVDVSIPLSLVSEFYVSDVEASAETPLVDGTGTVTAGREGVVITGLAGNATVEVYDAAGKLVFICHASDTCVIPYSDLHQGINIVNVNGISCKIRVK